MTLADLASRTTAWIRGEGPRADMVLSSRVRLARNLREPFPHRANDVVRTRIYSRVEQACHETDGLADAVAWNVDTMNPADRRVLVERHLASPDLIRGTGARGVLARDDEAVGVMINEEDHVRIQSVRSGLDLVTALEEAGAVDRSLEPGLDYAVCEDRGYLTACPSNAGTGLRASVLIHLPALVMAGEIRKVHRAVSDMGMAVRGWFGEGSRTLGEFFQLSNQRTLGRTEEETVDRLVKITERVLTLETEARERVRESETRRRRVEDRVFRSLGVLQRARLLTVEQVMACASDLRLGSWLGMGPKMTPGDLNRLALFSQPGHLGVRCGKELEGDAERGARADWVRSEFKGIP